MNGLSPQLRKLRDRLIKESPVKSKVGKEVLAETLAGLWLYQRRLNETNLSEGLPAEIARTLPAVASNIKRLCDALKVSEIEEEQGVTF